MHIKLFVVPLIILLAVNAIPAQADPPNLKVDPSPVVKDEVAHGATWGDSSLNAQQLIRELQKGGYIVYFRHTATEQKTVNWDDIDLQDCTTQRNLSELGRQQGRQIGEAFSSLGIKVSKVLSSPFCRCIDTARIAFGTAEISQDLLFSVGGDETLQVALGNLLGTQPLANSNTVLVSHSSNLRDTTGVDPKPEGLAAIFKPKSDGSYSFVATVLPDGWEKLLNEK